MSVKNNSLINSNEILKHAMDNYYAIPAFNVHNLETLRVVVDTAAKLKSPVIVAATPGTIKFSGFEYFYSMIETASLINDIPIVFHLDHHEDVKWIKKAIMYGVKSVMIDASHYDFLTNVKIVKEVVDFAHLYGASVEAELGQLVGIEDDKVVSDENNIYTNPDLAQRFVMLTGIDSLAIAIGTAHGLYKGEVRLDLDRLAAIKKRVNVPLVLHGASGVPYELVQECIDLGISKVNIATELKIPYAKALKDYFEQHPDETDPRKYFQYAKDQMEKVVIEKIVMCKSNNRY